MNELAAIGTDPETMAKQQGAGDPNEDHPVGHDWSASSSPHDGDDSFTVPQYRHPPLTQPEPIASSAGTADAWTDDLPMPGTSRPDPAAALPTAGPPPPPQAVVQARLGPEKVGMVRIMITSLIAVALLWYAMAGILIGALVSSFGGETGELRWHVVVALVASWLSFSFGIAQNEKFGRGLAGGAVALIGTVVLTGVVAIALAAVIHDGIWVLVASYGIGAMLTRMGRMTLIERRARESYQPFP